MLVVCMLHWVIHVGCAADNAILIYHFWMFGTLANGGSLAMSLDAPDPLEGRTMRVKKTIQHNTCGMFEMDCSIISFATHHYAEWITYKFSSNSSLPFLDIAGIKPSLSFL